MCPLGRNASPTTQLAQQPSTLMTNCRPNDRRTKKYRKKMDLHFMHDSRTWRQRTGVKTLSHPLTLLVQYMLYYFLAATKQLYKWYFPSVCPSVTPFSPCSHHHIIMKFSGVITMVKSNVHAKGQGQRSKVKVIEVNTQLSRFRTLTPVWIHIWQWNHAHSWKQHRKGALLFFKVIGLISRSHGS